MANNQQASTDELKDFSRAVIVEAAEGDRAQLISMLRKMGVNVPDNVSTRDLIVIEITTIRQNAAFRTAMKNYFHKMIHGHMERSDSARKFVNEDGSADGSKKAYEDTAVGGVLTKERIGSILDTALNVWANSANAKAIKEGEQSAMDQEKAKAAQYGSGGTSYVPSGMGWVKPVIILLILGGASYGIFRYYKSRKKAT